MSMLIQHRKPIPNRWHIREQPAPATAGEPPVAAEPAGSRPIVPLTEWQSLRDAWPRQRENQAAPIGVLLSPDEDPNRLSEDLDRLALLAVRFPAFTDGRGYSIARQLRQQLGWAGPLMALGDVLRDQLLLLERCGFDTFWLREDQDLAEALSAFDDFSDFYQAASASTPLFERRRIGATA